MVSSLILSYDNDPVFHVIPRHVTAELRNYHILAVREIYSSFRNKQHGIILNEEYGMNFPLQAVAFLSTYIEETFPDDPIVVITKENNLSIWKRYISEYTKFSISSFADYDVYTAKTCGLIIIGTDTEFKKCTTLKETDYFMVIAEDIDKVIRMRAMSGLRGEFHIGCTERNFYKERDMKLLWQIMRWAEPKKIGKLQEFTEEYNECLMNLIEPFQELWFRITSNYCDSFEKIDENTVNETSLQQKTGTKKSNSNKKRKSDQRSPLNTSTSKRIKGEESSASTSKRSNVSQNFNISTTSADSAFDITANSSARSLDKKYMNVDLNSSEDIYFDSSNFNLEQGRSAKKRKSDSPGSKWNKISPIKEKYFCSTLKYTPPKKKKKPLEFGGSRAILDLFEEQNLKANDSIMNNNQSEYEGYVSSEEFSLSLDCSPIAFNENPQHQSLLNEESIISPLNEKLTIEHDNDQTEKISLPTSFKTNKNKNELRDDNAKNNNNKTTFDDFTEDSEDFNLLTLIKGKTSLCANQEKPDKHLSHEKWNLLESNKSSKIDGNNRQKLNKIQIHNIPSTSKAGLKVHFNKTIPCVKSNPFDISTSRKGKQSKGTGILSKKHKSFCDYSEITIDQNVIDEFSDDFFALTPKEKNRTIRKTKSDTNIKKKPTKIIDKHVLEEFSKDFPINAPKKLNPLDAFIFKNVNNFFEGKDTCTPFVNESDSGENVWSVFRKGFRNNKSSSSDNNNEAICDRNRDDNVSTDIKIPEIGENVNTTSESDISLIRIDEGENITRNAINCNRVELPQERENNSSSINIATETETVDTIHNFTESERMVKINSGNHIRSKSTEFIEETDGNTATERVIEGTESFPSRKPIPKTNEEARNITGKVQQNTTIKQGLRDKRISTEQSTSSDQKSIYSQDTELNCILDLVEENLECLSCKNEIRLERCNACSKSVCKVSKGTQSTFEDILSENDHLNHTNPQSTESKEKSTASFLHTLFGEKRTDSRANATDASLISSSSVDKNGTHSNNCNNQQSSTSFLHTLFGETPKADKSAANCSEIPATSSTSVRINAAESFPKKANDEINYCNEKRLKSPSCTFRNNMPKSSTFFSDKIKNIEKNKLNINQLTSQSTPKKSFTRKYSKEEIISSIFDEDDILGNGSLLKSLFREDSDKYICAEKFSSKTSEVGKSGKCEILQSLFGD